VAGAFLSKLGISLTVKDFNFRHIHEFFDVTKTQFETKIHPKRYA